MTRGRDPKVTIVVARADNGVIGKGGTLPWRLPADLKHFKAATMGSAMVMGRKTFDSLPGLLPARRHIVLTRDSGWRTQGVEVAHSVEEAIALARGEPLSVIGGAEIIALFLPHADSVELTQIRYDAEGDTHLPPFDPAFWQETARQDHQAEDGRPAYSFVRLVRRDD